MSKPVLVVSCPNPEHRGVQYEHLWLLVGGGDYFDGARAFHVGPDRDIDGDDLVGRQLGAAIRSAEAEGLPVDSEEAQEALAEYRRSRR
jgi:hypothetical protein